MAAPITHIVLTEKTFDQFFSSKDKKAFYVDTSLPDIRYLGVIDRDKTHYFNVTLEEVIKEDSFLSGIKFHSLVDQIREDFYQKNNLYSLIPDSVYKTQAIKFYEDALLYSKNNSWKTTSNYFDKVYPKEIIYGLKQEDVKHWHKLLTAYFKKEPDNTSIKKFSQGISHGREGMSKEVLESIEIYKNIPEIKEKIYEMYSNFCNLLKCS